MGKVHHDTGGSDDDNAIEKTFTKGPWTQAEDDMLIAYVDQHGDGNWNAVQKHSGLSRCGKSCRLRWVNHLRPDLKKGAFTDEEELRVIELHAVLGNKWARMAGELPGRTDNEIKNFWNTRLKRLQRQGLPVYPDEVREQAMNAAAQSGLNTDSMDGHYSQDSLEANNVDIPELDFQLLPLSECSSYYKSMLRSVPTNNGFMRQRPPPPPCFFQPNIYNVVSSSPYMPSRISSQEESETATFDFTNGYAMNEESSSFWNYPFVEQLPDSHFVANATYSSSPSGPFISGDEKLELPSIQSFDSNDSWGTQQPKPPLELDSDNNTLVQSFMTDQTRTSSRYDGLLESIVYGGSSVERQATNTNSESSDLLGHTEVTPANANTTGQNFNNQTKEKEPFDGDWIKRLLGEDRCNKE